MTNVLEFDGIRALYGDALVVDDVSFAVAEGECFALLGPNGVGKTTTLNTLFGIARIGAGTVIVDGKSLRAKAPGA